MKNSIIIISRLGAASALLVIGFIAGRHETPSPGRDTLAAPTRAIVAPLAGSKIEQQLPEIVTLPAGANAGLPKQRDDRERQIKAVVFRNGTKPASGSAFEELLQNLRSWAAINPQAALNYSRLHLTLQRQSQAVTEILGDWAKADAPAAWAWATANVPENGSQLDAVLSRIGEVNGPDAWRYADEFAQTHPAEAQSVFASALRGITHAGDFHMAVQLVNESDSMGDGVRDGLSTLVATEWGRYEPDQAVAWAASLPVESVGRERAMVNVIQAWAEVDPSAAAKYATQLPAGSMRQQAVAQALPNWATTDPAAAVQWLYGQPPSHDFDQALNLVSTQPDVMADFPSAIALATSIFDPELRTQCLTRIVATMRQRDPSAASAFLRTSTEIPAEMRSAILSRLAANDLYAAGK